MLPALRRARGVLQVLVTTIQALESSLLVDRPRTSLLRAQLNVRAYHDEAWENSDNVVERPATPWVRTVQSGIELLRNPKYNKGMAFTKTERDRHYLHGLLPPAYMSQDQQVARVMSNLQEYTTDLQKYNHLMALQERNERLFYKVLLEHIEELLPVVYTPTVGLVCQQYGLLFRRPRGLFISIRDRGRVMELLKNWPERRVRVIVVTDGERVLGLGDLGVQGMGIPVGKLTLYTAIGGLHPSECLPVTLDVGTNNQALLKHPFYPGLRQSRVTGEEYDELVDEFMKACKARYGDRVLIQFEDFANHNAFRLLLEYRGSHLSFNDDIQGTAAVTLAGILGALSLTGGKVSDHTFLFNGAGEAGTGIAEMVALYISKEENMSIPEARAKIWMVDSKGLVVNSRMDSLQSHKMPFAKDFPATHDLLDCVKAIRPTFLIGVSGQVNSFTKEVCEVMAELNQRPVIFPLSNPTANSECTAEQAYNWTEGKCIFASGSPFSPLQVKGQQFQPGQTVSYARQLGDACLKSPHDKHAIAVKGWPEHLHFVTEIKCNNAYIFPGLGLGCIVSGSTRVRDEMFLAAAEALAAEVTTEDLKVGLVYPPLRRVRSVSAQIAKAVASTAYKLGLATNLPKPPNLLKHIEARMWDPQYRCYSLTLTNAARLLQTRLDSYKRGS